MYEALVDVLNSGRVVFMPSDTIYGLSCVALNPQAVGRLREIKERSEHKPFIVLISNVSQLKALGLPDDDISIMDKHWPGPVSLERDASNAPGWLHPASPTFAVRMPNRPELLELIDQTGPLTSTSANKEDESPAQTAAEAKKVFGDAIDFYVDAGKLSGQPSTLVKIVNGQLEVIRQGAYKI